MNNENENAEEQFVEDVQGGGEQQEPQTPPASKTMSESDLAAAFEKLGSTISTAVAPREQQQQATGLTDEEKNKLWAVYNPEESNKEFMKKFFRLNPDATEQDVADARALFHDMQKGFVRQAVVGSRNLLQIELDKLKKEYGFDDMRDYVREQRTAKLQTDFFSSYPSLAVQDETTGNYRYMAAIRIAGEELKNVTYTSRSAYFKALAEKAAEVVKNILPDFDLGATQPTKSATSTIKLPRTRVGGSGGISRGADAQDVKAVRGANGDDASTLDWS